MNFVPGLLKALAAGLIAAAVPVSQQLIAFFQGVAPADVSAVLWGAVSFVAVLVINFVVGKLPSQY